MITSARLKELLHYDPFSGEFFWLPGTYGYRHAKTSTKRSSGPIRAGTFNAHSRRMILVDGRRFYAHKLAWCYVYGKYPEHVVDHANRNQADDRIANLRRATTAENCRNRAQLKRALPPGVYQDTWSRANGAVSYCRRYRALITKDGVRHHLGTFSSVDEAARAYNEKRKTLFGEFA